MPAPKDFDEMWRELRGMLPKLRAFLRNPLANTGLSVPGPGVVQVDGDLEVNGPIDVHGTANFDGNTTIGGNAAITGTLSLPAGIIGNDALANPVSPAVAHADASGFSASTAWSTLMTATVAVPSGFTRALILSLSTNASVQNNSGSEDWLYVSASIPAYGGSLPGYVTSSPNVPTGKYGSAYDFRSVLLTGLSGSFTISGQVSTDSGNWGSDASNTANLDASILFLR